MGRMLGFVLVALATLGGVAQADQSVERSTPFTDYRQATADQYTVAPGNTGTGTTPNTSTPDTQGVSPVSKTNPGSEGTQPSTGTEPSSGVAGAHAGNGTVSAPSSGLPFTGFDLLTLVLLGVLLVAAGVALAALSRLRRALPR